MRAAFEQAADSFLETLRAVPADLWDAPGALGAWTTRELAAHTLRSVAVIEGYLDGPVWTDRTLADAEEYYAAALADVATHDGVRDRARDAARSLADPLGEAEVVVARVLATVATTADDEPVSTPVGQIALIDYLVTRVVEVGVHVLDLQRATTQPTELNRDTTAVVVAVLARMARPIPLMLALTGRAALPPTNVLS